MHGVERMYFPSWETKEDLQSVARYIRSLPSTNPKRVSDLQDAVVNARIDEFGYLIRPIFMHRNHLSQYRRDRDSVISTAKAAVILSGQANNLDQSHFLVQMRHIPTSGSMAFADYGLEIASKYADERLDEMLQKAD